MSILALTSVSLHESPTHRPGQRAPRQGVELERSEEVRQVDSSARGIGRAWLEKARDVQQSLGQRRRRKRIEEASSIAHASQARIQNRQHAPVLTMAQKPPEALLQRE